VRKMSNLYHLNYKYFFIGVIAILLSTVIASSADEYNGFEGLIEPSEVAEVSGQMPGIVDEILVERGDIVKKGRVIARLKSGVEKVAVELAHARVEFGRRKLIRNEELYRKQLLSIHEKDEMETELKIMELQLQEAQEKLELRIIRSPIDGVVVERLLSHGEYTGEETIMKIVQIDPLYVEVVIPVEQFGTIKKGMKAQVQPESAVGGKYTAEVIIVDSVIDAASGTFGVRLKLPNKSFNLPPGLKCEVFFLKR